MVNRIEMAVLKKRVKTKVKHFDLLLLVQWTKELLFDPTKTWIVAVALLLAEIVVNVGVIWKIKCESTAYCYSINFCCIHG